MSKTKKLPPAKDWRNRDIGDWNVTTFHAYMIDKHAEMFDCNYVPFGGGSMSAKWRAEQGMLGRLIGTRQQKGSHDKALIKRWIDECFEDRTKWQSDYPGINFGFIYTYKREILQRLEAEEAAENRREKARADAPSVDELTEWL